MKVTVIGGSAAGMKVTAKLLRECPDAEVTVLTREKTVSAAICGLPYFMGGVIGTREELLMSTPQKFMGLNGGTVKTGLEVTAVDPAAKTVSAIDLENGNAVIESYDKLIIATGASALRPMVPGADMRGVFVLRTLEDAEEARRHILGFGVKNAVVLGSSFTALEAADNLKAMGLTVTMVDSNERLFSSGAFDPEMSDYMKRHLEKQGIKVLCGVLTEEILGNDAVSGVKTSVGIIPCGIVIAAVGITPNTGFLKNSGILLDNGRVVVDEHLAANCPDVYAIGDCALIKNRQTGKTQWAAMSSSAAMEGRTLAEILAGKGKTFPGSLGTGILKLPGLNCGRTGLSEQAAIKEGYDVITSLVVTDDKPKFYPDSDHFYSKLIADKTSGKLLGVQVLGKGNVDKMIDIAVTGISMGMTLSDFENLDYAYAPPFSTAIHPFLQSVYVLENKLCGAFDSMTPAEYMAGKADGYTVVDVSPTPSVKDALFVDIAEVKDDLFGLSKEEKILLVCNRGRRAYILQQRLKFYGYKNVLVLEGSTMFNVVKVKGRDFLSR